MNLFSKEGVYNYTACTDCIAVAHAGASKVIYSVVVVVVDVIVSIPVRNRPCGDHRASQPQDCVLHTMVLVTVACHGADELLSVLLLFLTLPHTMQLHMQSHCECQPQLPTILVTPRSRPNTMIMSTILSSTWRSHCEKLKSNSRPEAQTDWGNILATSTTHEQRPTTMCRPHKAAHSSRCSPN